VKRKEAPVPKQTEEGRGEAGLTAVGSLLSLVSLENSSGTDLPSGVFSSASNAANLPAKDSVFYLDSLTSLLVAYSPGPFVNQDEANVRNLFSTMDANRNGTIDFDEAEQHEETERDLQLAVEKFEQSISHQELFLKMDTDGSGYLCRDELRRVLKEEGDYQDEQDLMRLFKKMDSNGDDAISFHEADDYERKDATNAYISPYLNTVANLLAKTKGAANASGTNASFAGDGLNVSYYRESLSQLLAAVSSKAFNATSMTGNESASYLESLSSLLAAYSSSRITPNSSAANSHNASYYGESWSRLLVGVFSSVSNASNLTANDSASYLESLSSLLVAYSPGSLMNTSNTPVPKQTEGTGAAWLASVGSLFSIVSSENASGTDAPE
jgi:Ca2+-binding EF-hand superfamily protein